MLQPRRNLVLVLVLVVCLDCLRGDEQIDLTRRKRQSDKDVTTVLLVDTQGRSSLGRYKNVKPDIGLIASTARTFIQDGVTTEYATHVLGTTFDNGRVYAHLLSKSSRVLNDQEPSKTFQPNKQWNVKDDSNGYMKNMEFIVPNKADAVYVFPTKMQYSPPVENNNRQEDKVDQDSVEEELLKEAPSNDFRGVYVDQGKVVVPPVQSNVKIFKISPQVKDLTYENIINHKETTDTPLKNQFTPTKVRPWDNLPTFTVRNEFSPSGLSYLGDFPEFEERTERSKLTTPAERKAKLLFRAGLTKPNPKDLKSITYTGFADFTTTVGDTVIFFTPHTSDVKKPEVAAEATKISVEATIKPTAVFQKPEVTTTALPQRPVMIPPKNKGPIEMKTQLPSMVIDKTDRIRDSKTVIDEHIDMDAKSAVLAHEQGKETTINRFTPDVIQPSETQPVMLSTPSDEDIAKIFASLQAHAKQATQPLQLAPKEETKEPSHSGATTIFFDDDLPVETSAVEIVSSTMVIEPNTEKEASVNQETTEKQQTTTEELLTTSDNIISTSPLQQTTPETKESEAEDDEEDEEDADITCTRVLLPTTIYKTLTYLTTFYIPVEGSTSTSIRSNEVINTEMGYETKPCGYLSPSTTSPESPSIIQQAPETEKPNNIETTTPEQQTTTEEEVTEQRITTVAQEVTTEEHQVTESEPETTEATTEEGEEIELIFKTLYTTYTYLTTYFQDTTSSIASRIVVTTNVITSTLDPNREITDEAVAGLMQKVESPVSKTVSFEDLADINPSNVVSVVPTKSVNSDDTEVDEEVEDSDVTKPTPTLDNNKVLETGAEGLKTYYTTYTYFTTIFVDGETEISSRTEVYTNYVRPSQATPGDKEMVTTKVPEADRKEKILKMNSYNTINRPKNVDTNEILSTPSSKEQDYVTLQRGTTTTEDNEIEDENSILDLSDYETIATMVTDVRSSTSAGDRRIIDSLDKRNVLLDDQIVSESNNESEIIPSPTLLLQTSYTTFTYFTTMYHGTTASDIVSRLETITNVVTQTLSPTQRITPEDVSLPVTYFTTFTYWTTLYKEGTTKVTSREETVSNVVTPTIEATSVAPPIVATEVPEIASTKAIEEAIVPSTVGDDDLTTYFTTYTYYTTSYIGDKTVLNSRLETVTNVLNNSDIATNQIGRSIKLPTVNRIEDALEKPKQINASSVVKPTGLLSTIVNTVENNGTATLLSTDVYGTYIDGLYAKVLESTSNILTPNISPSAVVTESLYPTGVVSINQGKIVDAEGVSTLLYTTKALGTYIDNLYTTVTESSSALAVDEEKKAALPTDLPIAHRTGLVRLIEGSIIANDTTTFYESKVLGTVIDGRYAQIIQSTSSFSSSPKASVSPSGVNDISPSATLAPGGKIASTATISPSPVVIEGSISDTVKEDAESSTEEGEEDDDDEKDGGRSKSRLTFQSRKRTFTPAIRPFASRQRPTFAPKRKQTGQNAAATITRSDFTPTVTAVPASRQNRFGARRSSTTPAGIQPTASGGRRFSRPKSSSAGGRRASSARIQPTSSGFGGGSRRGGSRTSSAGGPGVRPSSLFPARPRIRPTASLGLNRATSSQVTQSSVDDQNDLTTVVTDEADTSAEDSETTLTLQTTTEATSRRSQNPLLKFRRPPLRPTTATRTRSTTKRPASTTTTTARPRVTRPPSSLINRARPNALFPRRGLFTTTTQAPPPEEEEEVEVVEEGENEEDLEEEGDAEEDTDYDSSLTNTQTAKPPPKPKAGVSIRPFARRRSRRDTYSRFKRPTSRSTTAVALEEREEITEAPRFSSRGRFYPKRGNYKSPTTSTTTSAPTQSGRKRISPSKPLSQGRTQFTLRNSKEKLSMTTKRTNTRNGGRPTASSRQKTARGRYQVDNTNNRARQTPRTNNRGRGTQRQRYNKDDIDANFALPKFDGTITVTHQVPTEVTIPVVNGKVTEYKNVVSAKYSTEVLDRSQYTTSINPLGKEFKVLLSEKSEFDGNGATLITQFVLNETPTTTVLYTPTVINRRKTSFSHVVPSTKYDVEEVVTTIQPALAAQAPLANILLSQLLLGGLAPQPNALLGIQPGGYLAPTATTELKTKTTTYVTTVTNEISTVIPLTFRGKEILTTLISNSVSVVTATEYLTETVTVTPAFPVTPQFNTALLLPLLQQQLQQQQQNQQHSASQLLQAQQPADVFNLNTEPIQQQSLDDNENLALEESQELVKQQTTEGLKRRPAKTNKKNKQAPVEPPKETSIVTLYVSGRTPGEFTTLLSTVTVGEEEKRSKREVEIPVAPSRLPSQLSVEGLYDYIMPASEVHLEASELTKETESLESIIGDVSKHVTTQTPELFNIKPTKSAKASKKYKIKYVKASDSKKAASDAFLEIKRDASELSKRRVVKKLISVRPVQNASMEFYDTNNDLGSSNARRVPRRRLKIKKKKKRLLSNNGTSSDDLKNPFKLSDPNFDEEHIQEATKPRRKVVITRKRILPNSSKLSSGLMATEPQVTSLSATPTLEVQQSTAEVSKEDRDVTEENLVESIESTTIGDDDGSTEETEYDDEYYDDDEDTSTEETTEAVTEETTNTTEENLIASTEDDADDKPTFQDIPEYEPSFPELTESLDSPLLPLKTTVLSSIDLLTSTVTESKLRTYTFVVTRVSGTEQIITSTTEVRPQVKTTVLTEPVTKYTTLTLLDFDDTPDFISSTLDIPPSLLLDQENTGSAFSEEARYNLATRVMSNGVEVIVAGDKTTLPGDGMKRILPSSQLPITLKPSTLTDRMVLMMPQDTGNPSSSTPLLYNDQFITKTCLTTFTYLTTYLEGSTTAVSSHEQVVSNIATEERNTGKILPTPAIGITLTQYPNLSVGLFRTTYTYLNTILDGEQPLVVSSKHTVTNTVTAPDDYLSFLKPSETSTPLKDTNTYYSTINLEKTLYEGDKSSVISTRELVTQVIITESVPPRATSVMTSYIALDNAVSSPYSTTDVVKTYFVTYTYYNTVLEDGKEAVHKNISTSADVVTEKIYLQPKKQTASVINTEPITASEKKKQKIETAPENFKILATKSYFTTFTYFTTLLQDDQLSPTIVSSRSKVVENVVTETIQPSLVKENYLTDIRSNIRDGSRSVIRLIELQDGQKLEVTAVSHKITPTKVMHIEKTKTPDITQQNEKASLEPSSSSNVITGSTIVFIDDDPFAQFAATPSLSTKSNVASTVVTNLGSSLSSEIVKKTKVSTSKGKRNKNKTKPPVIAPTKIQNAIENTESDKLKHQLDKKDKNKQPNPDKSEPVSDLLGLGSININSLQALTPVLNAMAGLITTNLKPNRRSDNLTISAQNTTTRKPQVIPNVEKDDTQNRSPIYIPVGGLSDDFEIAESQNIATFEWVDPPGKSLVPGKATQETSLLNGGIPISPGDIITANSDVIVGKPGRIGPRIPSIPLNQLKQDEDIPVDMKPPPASNNPWPKKNYPQDSAPVGSVNNNVIHVPNKDDYIGPPPPLHGGSKDKRKHIPLTPPKKDAGSYYEKTFNQRPQVYANSETNYEPNHAINEINHEHNHFNLQESIQKNYHSVQSYPVYAQSHATPLSVPGIPINDFNIQPSVINEPIVLPEVIERSTGQPLLVNIQPSQVAFVNIPFNRTTALIYGGSTEPHRNGQYFDDPSPYPDSGYSDIAYNRNVPQVNSVAYERPSPDQKQVNGVIKVGNQLINIEPEVSENQKVLVNIKPSKPQYNDVRPSMKHNHEVNVNVPPISFGLVQQGNEFHAHVINHNNDIEFRPPPQPYEVVNPQINHPNNRYPQTETHPLQPLSNEILSQPQPGEQRPSPRPPAAKPDETLNKGNLINKPKYPFPPKRNMFRLKPQRPDNVDIKDYMTPPPYIQSTLFKRPPARRPASQRPQPIPLGVEPTYSAPQKPSYHHQTHQNKIVIDGPGYQIYNKKPTEHQYIPSFSEYDMDIGDHEEDDLPNEDGEVIQESNSRPLLPGEVPLEILKAKTTTTERPRNNSVRFPSDNRDRFHSRPDQTTFEKQQQNRINVIDTDYNALRTSTERVRPIGGFIVVGNQFEGNDGPNQIVVSGSQFNNKNPYNNQAHTSTEKTTTQEYHRFSESTYGNVFSFNTKTTPVTTISPTTSRKPVLIFLDDTGKQSNNFFNNHHERPSVTSLPIDVQAATTQKNHSKHLETQTEKPFIPQQNPSLSSNEIVIKEESTTTTVSTTPDLNTGEITVPFSNVSKEISDMEIMKPPPLVTDLPVNPPNSKPSRLPEKGYSPTKPPSHPLEELVPPPPTTTEEVLGMSPPPLVTTYRPPLKPIFPVQTNISKYPSTTSTTERYRHTRPSRRPLTRRPTGFRTSTTPVPITTRRRPSYPGYEILKRNSTTPKPVISPSPTVQSKPSLQVIIGNPSLNAENKTVAEKTRPVVELAASEASTKEQTTERTASLSEATDLSTSEGGSIVPSTRTKEDIVTKAVHHAGNEIKIIDETPSVSTKLVPSSSILPTRYITYTKTSTVTITRTTVVRTSGLPPSTLTILVTKTEKSTIVDTVTEVHTLVKPTSIIETITTTVHQGSSLYPPDMYGSPYPSVQVKPSTMKPLVEVSATSIHTLNKEESLEDFIITSPDVVKKEDLGQDSILVVMTDKNTKNIVKVPNETVEIQSSEEVEVNSVENNLLLGGIFIGNRPHRGDKCEPECKPARNELCQKLDGTMRCVCRPGFARIFLDRPCLPTYTYDIQLTLDRMGKEPLYFNEDLSNTNSSQFLRYARPIREALDRMVMQSDLRDIFHGVEVHAFGPSNHSKGIVSMFYLQLSDNMEESRLEEVFRKYLRNNSYSLGGTDVFASSPIDLKAHDFDECAHPKFHDCSENAKCFNLKGTYTCSCKEGYADMSENMLYPGRVCSAEVVGCERCSYHGTCYSRGHDDVICECFPWYTGDSCHVNLKVLLIALVTLGVLLLMLFVVCIIMSCVKRKPSKMAVASGLSFLPQRVSACSNRGTIDRRAMIQDTSSEDSRSETNTLPYVQNKKKPKGALKKTSKVSEPSKEDNVESTISFADQKDRSLTVMIPRAKYHPAPPTSPILNYTSFDARKPSVPSITSESKLICYLDAGPSPGKTDQTRKASTAPTETIMEEKPGSRKTSGALVSAGFEVSATVVNNMGTLGTTCGTEADRSENATLIQKISADLLSSADTRSQFNTLRQSIVEDDESSSNWLDIVPRVMTVSEARSYDETTIPPPMKSFRTDYESKLSSHPNDEANTMAERDLGSTFLLPHTHLYKPDRGSDISGFESL